MLIMGVASTWTLEIRRKRGLLDVEKEVIVDTVQTTN
jgi:hypothetical protein